MLRGPWGLGGWVRGPAIAGPLHLRPYFECQGLVTSGLQLLVGTWWGLGEGYREGEDKRGDSGKGDQG